MSTDFPRPTIPVHFEPTPLHGDWQSRLSAIVATMKDMSRQTDPQQMVKVYGDRMQELMPVDRRLSLSRRGLSAPQFKITRFSGWDSEINPWKEEERLPILSGGLLAELIYGDEPRILLDLQLDSDDPARFYLKDQRSLLALPLYDQGKAINMVIVARKDPHGFSPEELPERVWMSNLFGRATQNLVMADRLEEAYQTVDRELQAVADIQRSLLPMELPVIPGLRLATHYQTSKRAGGDYYDFFPLAGNRWAILLADVSGHGTPAAVMMAITHCIAHMRPEGITHPSGILEFLNFHLASRYTMRSGHFVTAFCAIFDPATLRLTYSSAGHNPPRWMRGNEGAVVPLDDANFLPLGIFSDLEFRNREIELQAGDRLVLYTDGIIESTNSSSDQFGTSRLDQLIANGNGDTQSMLDQILETVDQFMDGQPATDDRTLLVLDVDRDR